MITASVLKGLMFSQNVIRVLTGSSDINSVYFLLNTVSVMEKRRKKNPLLKPKLDSRFNYFLEDLSHLFLPKVL